MRSQNGYIAHTSSGGLVPLKWITGRVLPGDVHTVFDHFCARFDAEVEKIKPAWSWGWNYRAIRGATTTSNHASGTAIDLNAPVHGLGSWNTFSPRQQVAIRKILKDLDGALRWGGDYKNRPDDMHFEVDVAPVALAKVAEKIRAGALPGADAKPAYTIKLHPVSLPWVRHQFRIGGGVKPGKVRPTNGVARIQAALNAELKPTIPLVVDGIVGKDTLAAWKAWEQKVGGTDLLRIPDRKSLSRLGRGRFRVTKLDQ